MCISTPQSFKMITASKGIRADLSELCRRLALHVGSRGQARAAASTMMAALLACIFAILLASCSQAAVGGGAYAARCNNEALRSDLAAEASECAVEDQSTSIDSMQH